MKHKKIKCIECGKEATVLEETDFFVHKECLKDWLKQTK